MKKYVLSIFLAAILSSMAFALKWSEVSSMAERNSHTLKAAVKQVESAEWSYRRAFSTFMPQVSANAGVSETITASPDVTIRSYSYGLSATQYLFKGMAGYYDVQSAYARLEYQKAVYQSTKASVLYDVRSAFIDLLTAQENVKLLERIVSQRKQNSRMIQLRYDGGREDKGNLMTTKADEASARYQLSSAKRDLKLARLKLSQLLGQEITGKVEGDELRSPKAVDIEQLLEQAPDYVSAKKTLEQAELAQNSTISNFLPSLSLSGSYRKTGEEWPPESESKSWSLTLSYSLFPGIDSIADRAIAGADLDKAKEDFTSSINDLRYSLEQSYQDYQNAIDALEVSRTSLAASEERAKIVDAKYQNGLTNYDEWYRIVNAYIQAQISLLNSRKQAMLAEAQWHKRYGGWVK